MLTTFKKHASVLSRPDAASATPKADRKSSVSAPNLQMVVSSLKSASDLSSEVDAYLRRIDELNEAKTKHLLEIRKIDAEISEAVGNLRRKYSEVRASGSAILSISIP